MDMEEAKKKLQQLQQQQRSLIRGLIERNIDIVQGVLSGSGQVETVYRRP